MLHQKQKVDKFKLIAKLINLYFGMSLAEKLRQIKLITDHKNSILLEYWFDTKYFDLCSYYNDLLTFKNHWYLECPDDVTPWDWLLKLNDNKKNIMEFLFKSACKNEKYMLKLRFNHKDHKPENLLKIKNDFIQKAEELGLDMGEFADQEYIDLDSIFDYM